MPDSLNSEAYNTAATSRGRMGSASEKRRLIIESAERLFAQRGFLQTTIADISNDCGVHEASIFQYFKTKENLLVAIPERHLDKTLAGITEHLQGMKGAEPKLRKLMWHQLRDLSLNRDYTSILLRELRTLPAFYQSPAYEMLRRYSAFGAEALREGMEDGEVYPDVEPILVLEMIFGAIDSVVLRWLFFDHAYDPVHVADALCSLVKAAVWKRDEVPHYENGDEPTRGELKRRLIMTAASEVFGKKGFAGATISEIAGRAGIAEASIYQYFRSKEDLLLCAPGNWFNALADELQNCFSGRLDPADRLRYILRRWYLDFQLREWETRVLILELYRNPKFYESQAYKNTHVFWRLIRSTVEEGRESGVFNKDFEIDYYLHLIQGAFDHEALARMMLSKRQATFVRGEHMIDLLLRAIKA
jgi:TetR/AcrR family transcriptional regulator, fatty acid metabolism regulator protein